MLQEFFENNAYPKDDDLEYLSKLLGLSPRVIVVWFQNARQKARKIYENQPPIDPNDDGAGRFTRTPGLNYQCKKCLLVFQVRLTSHKIKALNYFSFSILTKYVNVRLIFSQIFRPS